MKKIIFLGLMAGAGLLLSGCTTTQSSKGPDGTCTVVVKNGDTVVKNCTGQCDDLSTFAKDCKGSN